MRGRLHHRHHGRDRPAPDGGAAHRERGARQAPGRGHHGLRHLHARPARHRHRLARRRRADLRLPQRGGRRPACLAALYRRRSGCEPAAGGPPCGRGRRPVDVRGLARAQGRRPVLGLRPDPADPGQSGQPDRLRPAQPRHHRAAAGGRSHAHQRGPLPPPDRQLDRHDRAARSRRPPDLHLAGIAGPSGLRACGTDRDAPVRHDASRRRSDLPCHDRVPCLRGGDAGGQHQPHAPPGRPLDLDRGLAAHAAGRRGPARWVPRLGARHHRPPPSRGGSARERDPLSHPRR